MTASRTAPIRIPSPLPRHEHAWMTESAHRTSEGEIVYVRCTGCGARRVDLRGADGMPPAPWSRVSPAVPGTQRMPG
ncbi:MAG TPA: hypothetical protein VN041_11625 [Microbacterium sp.]|nr:hypothetical protein [Microbacterium sp.]